MNAHPAAETFPMMTSDELRMLAEDIRVHGLHRAIVLMDGMILDGRNRLEACKLAGVTPRFVQFDGDDPWAYVWSENAERRHLRPDQFYLPLRDAKQLCIRKLLARTPGQMSWVDPIPRRL